VISRRTAFTLSAPLVAASVLFLVVPVALLAWRAVNSGSGSFTSLIGSQTFREALGGTIVLAGTASLASTTLALLLAFALQRLPDRSRSLYLIVASIPLAFSGLIVAYGFLLLLGRSGSLTIMAGTAGLDTAVVGSFLFTPSGLALAYAYFLIPRALLILEPVVAGLSVGQTRSARSLGAGWLLTLISVIWPQLRAGVLRALAFCFAVAAGAYSTALALAGADLSILPVLLLARISQGGAQAGDVAWLALSLVALSLLGTIIADQLGAEGRNRR